jgi:hypothetical protein
MALDDSIKEVYAVKAVLFLSKFFTGSQHQVELHPVFVSVPLPFSFLPCLLVPHNHFS